MCPLRSFAIYTALKNPYAFPTAFKETARLCYPEKCKSQRSDGFTLHASLCRSARSWAHPSALAPPRVAWRTRARRKWTPSGATAVSRPGKRTEPLPVSHVHGAARETPQNCGASVLQLPPVSSATTTWRCLFPAVTCPYSSCLPTPGFVADDTVFACCSWPSISATRELAS